MSSWLTVAAAAKRIDRSERTIRRWAQDGDIRILNGQVIEKHLLEVDRQKRKTKRGRAAVVVPLVATDGRRVGHLRISPDSGEITGQIDTPPD